MCEFLLYRYYESFNYAFNLLDRNYSLVKIIHVRNKNKSKVIFKNERNSYYGVNYSLLNTDTGTDPARTSKIWGKSLEITSKGNKLVYLYCLQL